LAHGVQADVADGMVLSAGWLLHDEHPLTVPCAEHSSISPAAEPCRDKGCGVAHRRVS